jgi:hypothetical protein
LSFRTSIASPQPAASGVGVGDVLEVALDPGPPAVIQVLDAESNVVGSIITHIPDLLRCIQDGFTYEAEVVAIEGGDLQIAVHPT